MSWLKYCKRVSKETNVGFVATWAISPIYDFIIHGIWDLRAFVGFTLCMITVYCLMVFITKVTIWDRRVIKKQINEITERQYNGYIGDRYKSLHKAHTHLRKQIGDKRFLSFLQDQEKTNPKPIYTNEL